MKPHALLLAAAFVFTACDGEKVKEAKEKTTEAAKSLGEAAKEMGGKAMEKGKEMGGKLVAESKELGAKAGDKLKGATEAAKAVLADKGGPALESFKAKMGGLSEWFKNAKGQAGEDPAKAHQLMSEMMGKVKSISPEGLPPDLKSAFERYQGAMNRVQDISKSLPTDQAGAEQWYKTNADKLGALENDVLGAFKVLKEAAAKHGLTGLDLGTE